MFVPSNLYTRLCALLEGARSQQWDYRANGTLMPSAQLLCREAVLIAHSSQQLSERLLLEGNVFWDLLSG